jgi:hypothetical protein
VNRKLWISAAVVAVVAIVIVVALRPGDQTGTTVASQSPSATASASARPSTSATATVSATGSPASTGTTAVYNDDFGFVVANVGASASIRKESSNARIGTVDGQSISVSPDGRQLAFFTVPGSSPGQLKVVSASNPNSLVFSSSLSANERGGAIVWTGDSSGLAYAIHTGSPTTVSVIRTVVLSAGGPAQTAITSNEAGKLLQPFAWNRGLNLVSGGVMGDGGFMTEYFTVDAGATASAKKSFPVQGHITVGSVRATNDTKFVLGVDTDSGEVLFWPLTDFGQRKAASGNGKQGALWQPGTHKIGFMSAADNSFILFQADDGSASTPFRGAKAGNVLRTFRADGSAVVLAFAPNSAGLGSADFTLYRLSDGASVTFQDLGGLSASVRLR